MRNLDVPKVRRHKPKNLAYVWLDGGRVYLGKWGSPEIEAKYDAVISEWISNGRRLPSGNSELTIAELVDLFEERAKGRYASSGPKGELAKVKRSHRPLVELYGATLARKFSAIRLERVRDTFIADGLGRLQIESYVRRIIRTFEFGVAREITTPEQLVLLRSLEPLRHGEAPDPVDVEPVSDEDVDATLLHLPPTVRAMVEMQRLTGMRPGEVVQMVPGAIDRTGEVWIYKPPQHKGKWKGKPRLVPLGPKAQAILKPFVEGRPEDKPLFSPREVVESMNAERSANRKTPKSCGNRAGSNRKAKPKKQPGERYSTHSYGRAIKTACRKAKVRDWAPHRLRHAFADKVCDAKGIEDTSLLLGHASLAATRHYLRWKLVKAAAIAKEIG